MHNPREHVDGGAGFEWGDDSEAFVERAGGTASGDDELEEFRAKATWPFLVGAYMATNAIADAYLIVDSPDCAFFKAEHIYGRHDLASTLLDCAGSHRVINTRADVGNIINDRRTLVQGITQTVYDTPEVGAVLVTSMPMAMVTGVEYGLLVRACQAAGKTFKPAAEIPCASLAGDWIDGYDDTLTALADAIVLPDVPREPGSVAVVGHMMDRNEADGIGNVKEMRRMLEALGLDPVAIWPSGGTVSELAAVGRAELLIAHPYGRGAARALAARTGARVLDLDVPFGVEATARWLRAIATATDTLAAAEAFIDTELSTVVPRLEWVVANRTLGRRVALAGDPYVVQGLRGLLSEMGAKANLLVTYGRPERLEDHSGESGEVEDMRTVPGQSWERSRDAVYDAMHGPEAADLLICDGEMLERLGFRTLRFLEFGYPSLRSHALYEAPFLGFRGALWMADAISNRLGLLTYTDSR